MRPVLRDYQLELKENINKSIADGHRGICAVSPTGSGKSKLQGDMISDFVLNGKQVLLCVHRQELVKQLSSMLCEYGLTHQIIAASETIKEAKFEQFKKFGRTYVDPFVGSLYVCSVQTLSARLDKLSLNPDVIFGDEFHHWTQGSLWGKIVEKYKNALLLGFTASPERLDGKGLGINSGGYCTDLVMGAYVDDLIDNGYLSEYIAMIPSQPINIPAMRESKTGAMSSKMADGFRQEKGKKVCADLISHYSKHCPHKPMVAYAVNIKASEEMAEAFIAEGFKAIAINGNTSRSVRTRALNGLESGEYEVVCNADLISEGFDVPELSAVGLCRPTQSLSLHIQQIGRPLRPHKDKKHAFIFDCVGNISNLDHYPCTRRNWSLDGKVGRKREGDVHTISIRKCPSCGLDSRIRDSCIYCGYVFTKQENEMLKLDIELKAITPEDLKRMRDEQREETRKDQNQLMREAQTAADLAAIDAKLGYARGATAYKKAGIEKKRKAMAKLNKAIKHYKENVAWGDPVVFDAILTNVFGVTEQEAKKYGAKKANELIENMREFLELRNSQIERPYSNMNFQYTIDAIRGDSLGF